MQNDIRELTGAVFAVLNKMKNNDQLNEVLKDIMSTLLNEDTSSAQM